MSYFWLLAHKNENFLCKNKDKYSRNENKSLNQSCSVKNYSTKYKLILAKCLWYKSIYCSTHAKTDAKNKDVQNHESESTASQCKRIIKMSNKDHS